MKIAVIVGSLRKESFNLKMAKALIKMAPANFEMNLVEIRDLALYNEDSDKEQVPASWKTFRDTMSSAEGVLFVTPEYNRSVPGALKNAIDVGSRPYGKSIWSKKPAAVVSVSPGAAGAFGANHHLRQSLVFLDMPTLQQPEAYIGHANDLFDDQNEFKNEKTKEFMKSFLDAFAAWALKTKAH